MGSGKSTIGKLLADQLGWDFIDLDAEIEATEKATVAQIFEDRGESEFRRIETQTLKDWVRRVERGIPVVVSLGGGAFVEPGNFELIENHGITVFIDCAFETVERRLATSPCERLKARDPEGFRRLYFERRAGYERADFRIDGDCQPHEAVSAIVALPLWK
jgi:shikimate kinase